MKRTCSYRNVSFIYENKLILNTFDPRPNFLGYMHSKLIFSPSSTQQMVAQQLPLTQNFRRFIYIYIYLCICVCMYKLHHNKATCVFSFLHYSRYYIFDSQFSYIQDQVFVITSQGKLGQFL